MGGSGQKCAQLPPSGTCYWLSSTFREAGVQDVALVTMGSFSAQEVKWKTESEPSLKWAFPSFHPFSFPLLISSILGLNFQYLCLFLLDSTLTFTSISRLSLQLFDNCGIIVGDSNIQSPGDGGSKRRQVTVTLTLDSFLSIHQLSFFPTGGNVNIGRKRAEVKTNNCLWGYLLACLPKCYPFKGLGRRISPETENRGELLKLKYWQLCSTLSQGDCHSRCMACQCLFSSSSLSTELLLLSRVLGLLFKCFGTCASMRKWASMCSHSNSRNLFEVGCGTKITVLRLGL